MAKKNKVISGDVANVTEAVQETIVTEVIEDVIEEVVVEQTKDDSSELKEIKKIILGGASLPAGFVVENGKVLTKEELDLMDGNMYVFYKSPFSKNTYREQLKRVRSKNYTFWI